MNHLADEQNAKERRIAAEKAAKKRKKAFAIETPIVCACIAFVIILTGKEVVLVDCMTVKEASELWGYS